MRLLSILLVLCLAQAVYGQPSGTTPAFSLRDAVSQAFLMNPSIRRKVAEALAEESAVERLRADELPRFFLESVYKSGFPGAPNFSFRGFIQSSTIQNVGADAVFSYTYDFGRSSARTASQQHNANASRADERAQMGMIALRVVRAYHDVLLAQALQLLEDKNLEARSTVANYAETRFRKGTIGRIDVGLAQAGLAEAKVRQIRARNDLSQALALLANSIGVETIGALGLAESNDTPARLLEGTLDGDLRQAIERRPEMESLRARVHAGEEAVAAAEAGHLPTLRFLATTGGLETKSRVVPNGYAVGVALTFPIYSGGGVEAEAEEAQHRLTALGERVNDQAQTVRLEITRARLFLSSLLESEVAAAERVRQASDSEHLATLRYKHGMGSIMELQQAQLALLSAQTDEARLRYDTLTACYALRFARGEISESFGGTP